MAQTPTDDTDARIARIDALTANGRTNWFGLMAYLAFALVTVLAVEDVDFFDPRRNTDLPLIGVSIPTFSFFIFAPLLGAALYVYLHLTLRKATEALCTAPRRIGADALEERIKPWLLNDMVLRMRGTDDAGLPAATRRPLDIFAMLSAIVLIWLAGPALLALMWVRSWPAHDWALSLTIAAALLVTVFAGCTTLIKLAADLGGDNTESGNVLRNVGLGYAALLLLMMTMEQTFVGVPQSDGSRRLAQADLSGARFSVLPPEQADPVAARQRYRAEWCGRLGIPSDICGSLPAPGAAPDAALWSRRGPWCQQQGIAANGSDACRAWFAARDEDFRIEWTDYRHAVIAALPKPDLSGRDLRGADLSFADAVGMKLTGTNLEGAELLGANFEGSNLTCDFKLGVMAQISVIIAQYTLQYDTEEVAHCLSGNSESRFLGAAVLTGANLSNTHLSGTMLSFVQMEGANLSNARMEGAVLQGARMEGADIRDARMAGADLSFARMEGADLSGARMEGVDLSDARMEGVDLRLARMTNANWARTTNKANPAHFADLRGGVDLDQARLSSLIGNAATLLPDTLYPAKGAPLYIPSCWAIDPPGYDYLVAGQVRSGTTEENLRDPAYGLFCAPGEVPLKTGTPWPVDAPPPWGAQTDRESDRDYHQRIKSWVAEQPPGEPIN